MVYLTLAYEFLKTGLFAIGGGLATLPFLYQIADRHPWFTREALTDMIAISESTPGPIGLNMATYAGYAAGGAFGGVLASLSVLVPSFFIIAGVVKVLDKFKENRLVKAAFYGIRPAVTALIASAALGIASITLLDRSAFSGVGSLVRVLRYDRLILCAALFYLTNKYKKHPACYIGGAALIGALFNF
jgi:chromate transporter